jgi:hypothetical protein
MCLWKGKGIVMPKIEDVDLDIARNYLDNVTYVPGHANGNAGHKDCQKGVIISFTEDNVKVLYCDTRTVQATNPKDLVWG